MKWVLYIIVLIVVANIIISFIARATLASNPALLNKVIDIDQANKAARDAYNREFYGHAQI